MEDKVISMAEAVRFVRPGDTLALGGITLYRRPVAFAYGLIAEAKRALDLTILSFTAGYEADILIGAGLASSMRSCFTGFEVFGLAPMFTDCANKGLLKVIEETEASLAHGIRAHLAGVSFMPGLGWIGTDLPRLRPDVKIIDDPYRPGECVAAFPAIKWDVAVIHALEADRSGNAVLNDNLGIDIELSLGARDVVITAEKVFDRIEGKVNVSGMAVRAVVEAPYGAWPTSCYPLYPVGGGELLRYIDACNGNQFEEYLKSFKPPA